MRFTKIAVIVSALAISFIPTNRAMADDGFQIEIQREQYRRASKIVDVVGDQDWKIQATSDDVYVKVCDYFDGFRAINCDNYTIGSKPSTIKLHGVVWISIPKGCGKVRISAWR